MFSYQTNKFIFKLFLLISLFILSACSDKTLTVTANPLPEQKGTQITLFTLQNYTDTPRAGKRAVNIVEGLLVAKGYQVILEAQQDTLDKKLLAQQNHSKYYMTGAVSEWRYKTGIDGEPAVSLRLALYDTKTGTLVWSATGANNDWGTGSIGTTAQKLIYEMFE